MKGKFICYKDFADVKPINVFRKDVKNSESEARYLNKHVLYRKKFVLDDFDSAVINITADDYFKLYINGNYVMQGPVSGYPSRYYYLKNDVAKFLRKGENVIAVHAYYQGLVNHALISADMRQMLWCELYVDDKLTLVSDESWKCALHSGFSECGRFGYSTQFAERYDSRSKEVNFQNNSFDDKDWEFVSVYHNADWKLVESSTQLLEEYEVQPKVLKKTDKGYFIDFGQEAVGYLAIKAAGNSGDEVTLHFGEELNEDGSVRFDMRCNCRYEEFWVLGDGESVLDEYDYKAFRYVELIVPNNVRIFDIRMKVRHYPFVNSCKFNVDGKLKDIINLCIETVKYGTQDKYVDCPTREKGHYLGDLAISGRAQAILTGDATLLKASLTDFCESTFIDKSMLAVTGSTLNQSIADYSLLFAALCLWVYRFDGDREFLRYIEPYATGINEYFTAYQRADGLIENVDKTWNLVDWPQNLRDGYDFKLEPINEIDKGAHNVLNAFYIGQLIALKEIYSILEKPFDINIEKIKTAFIKSFFYEKEGLFADNERKTHFAVHSSILPLLFGIGTDNVSVKEKAIEYISNKKLTSMGVYMAYFALAALIKNGRKDLAEQLATDDGAWLNMLKEGATTTFEAWGKNQKWNTSLFHPWAVAPVVVFSDKEIY